MIDNFAILFSTVMIVVTILRAWKLNGSRAWFEIRPVESGAERQADSDVTANPGRQRP